MTQEPRSSALSGSLFPFHSLKLPLEVCEAIIGFVDKDNYSYHGEPYRYVETEKSLYSCALVCRSWVPKARIHLFRIVTIHRRSASNIIAAITTSPELGAYIRRVNLSGHYRRSPKVDSAESITHNEWIYDFFKQVIPLLTNLTFFQYFRLPPLHSHFYVCPPRIPSLTSLSLFYVDATSVGDVLRLISYYNSLKELYITEYDGGTFGNHHYHFGQHWRCNLRLLSIQRSTIRHALDLFYWLAQLKTSCSFEHLILRRGYGRSIDIEEAPIRTIPDNIALGWASTLKTLSLNFLNGDDYLLHKPTLVSELFPLVKNCFNLHTIRLRTKSDRCKILEQLPDVLRELNSLRYFALSFEQVLENVLMEKGGELWAAVDGVFVDSGLKLEYFEVMWYHLSLEKFDRLVGGNGLSMSDLEVYVDLLKGHFADFHRKEPLTSMFPRLSTRGLLWYSLDEKIKGPGVDSGYALQITPGISSPDWNPRYCRSLLDSEWHPDY